MSSCRTLSCLQVAADSDTRRLLVRWQAEDGVPANAGLPDPPLLPLEIEAATAQLGLLRLLAEDVRAEGHDKETVAVEEELFAACKANMERFEGPAAALDAERRAGNGATAQARPCLCFGWALLLCAVGCACAEVCVRVCVITKRRRVAPL